MALEPTPLPNPVYQLSTLGENGEPPKSRLTSASDAQSIITTMIYADADRNKRYALLKGMFDGNPPYANSRLKAQNQSWRSNFSSLEGKALRSSAAAPYYDLFYGSKRLANIELENQDPKTDTWNDVVAEEFDLTLRRFKAFHSRFNRMISDFVGYGRGFIGWDDPIDWMFQQWPQDRVLFPDGAKADPDLLEMFAIRQKWGVDQLWSKIKDRKTAEARGWHVDSVVAAIQGATPDQPDAYMDFVGVQQQFTDHDLLVTTRSSVVQASHLFVKEFSGKWSWFIVLDFQLQKARNGGTPEVDFLFKDLECFDELPQFFCPFIFEEQDQTWHGLSGLGKDIFPIMQAKDRLRCGVFDNVFMRSSIVLQAKTAQARQKINLVQIGPTTVIPEDFEVQQSTIFGDINSALQVNRDTDNMLQANTGIYRPRLEKPEGNPITATEAQINLAQSTVLGNSAVNRFYEQLDWVYAEIYRRMIAAGSYSGFGGQAAKAFIERCVERGVPRDALKKVRAVTAERNTGNGSMYLRQQANNALLPLMQTMPEDGRQAFLVDYAATYTNRKKAEKYFPAQQLPNDQQAWATLENAALSEGAPVLWTPEQNNVIHAQTHLQAGALALSSVQQGGNPTQVLVFLDGVGKHTLVHLQRLQADPTRKDIFEILYGQWQQMAKATTQLHQHTEQMMQQQQEQAAIAQHAQSISAGMDPDTQLKAAELQAKIGMQQQKQQASLMQKEQKHIQSQRLADATTSADIQRQNAIANQKIAEQAALGRAKVAAASSGKT